MQRTTKQTAPRGRSNLTTNRRVPVPTNRNVSVNRTKAPASKSVRPVAAKPAAAPKPEEPKVDTRTAEEIDRSYKEKLARFNAAKNGFQEAMDKKVKELKEHFGVRDAPQKDSEEDNKSTDDTYDPNDDMSKIERPKPAAP